MSKRPTWQLAHHLTLHYILLSEHLWPTMALAKSAWPLQGHVEMLWLFGCPACSKGNSVATETLVRSNVSLRFEQLFADARC